MEAHPHTGHPAGLVVPDIEPALVQGIDHGRVSAWLEDHVDGLRAPFRFEAMAGGHSNLTVAVTDARGRRVVLRRPPLGELLPRAHDVSREYRIIRGLAGSAVPVPPALAMCDDLAVTGAPFYVMGFVDGHVLRDRTAAESALTPEGRRRASESIVDTLAAIHAVDLRATGLDDLGRHEGYIARQLRRWYGQWNEQHTRDLPAVHRVHDALAAHIPAQGPATIVHGDYRLDNTMVSSHGAVTAVLDWEICTLGDPLADLGLLLVYWTGPGDAASPWGAGATSAPGFLDRDDLVARYARVSGRDVAALEFHIAFAHWKLACILEGVYARYLGGALGARDATELAVFRQQVESAAARAEELVEGMR